MRIGVIGPSKLREKDLTEKAAEIVAGSGHEIVVCPDKGSASEYFAQQYLAKGGKTVYEIVPLDDKEFGYSLLNLELGKKINCKTWRNQPEKLNEETDVLLCIGYAAGVLAEIAYSKWFKPKPVYIIKEFVSEKLPKEFDQSLKLSYPSIFEIEKILKSYQ